MTDIDDIREKKLEELKNQAEQEEQVRDVQQQQQEEAERQKEALLKKHLEEGARRRLNNVQMAKPEFGEQVEQQILQLIQSGQVAERITEEQMKQILQEINDQQSNNSYNIKGAGLR